MEQSTFNCSRAREAYGRKRRTSAVLLAKTLRAQVLSHRAIREDQARAEITRDEARADAEAVLSELDQHADNVDVEVSKDVRWELGTQLDILTACATAS
jgi:hypothetical protein